LAPKEQWNIKFGVDNLTDERVIVSGFEAGALPFTVGSFNRGREFYVQLGYNF
jgi:outer membrane receptor protein involved in Fe transport